MDMPLHINVSSTQRDSYQQTEIIGVSFSQTPYHICLNDLDLAR